VLEVFRNRERKSGAWIFSEKDTRIVVCNECGKRYFSESKLTAEIDFNMSTLKRYEKNLITGQTELFE
jgi:hypothetical protein